MKKTKQIDFYGEDDNYIHLKFGDARKMHNFTSDFIYNNKLFCDEYKAYLDGKDSQFKNVFQVVSYIYNNKLDIHFYFNFTDTPAYTKEEVFDYILSENDLDTLYSKK